MLCIMCIFSLSVSESKEWVCTKTVFSNGTIVRGCEKTYTGKPRTSLYHCLCRYLVSACNQINRLLNLLHSQAEKQYLSVSGAMIKVKVAT